MADDKRDGGTRELIAAAEALRSREGDKKIPSTRQLVRDAEQLIGRQVQPEKSALVKWALAGVLFAALFAALYLLLG